MFISFMLKAALISLSGVLSPGPITAVTVSKGTEHPLTGLYVSIGHAIVELPLMVLIAVGLDRYLQIDWVRIAIGILGGLFLLKMGFGLLKNIFSTRIDHNNFSYSPIQAGIILSISNPYFLIWWSTVGAMLLSGAYQFGLIGVIIFMFVHLGCDFLWYIFLSSLTFKGGQFFGQRLQQALFVICGLFLLFFSGKFIYDAMSIVF